MSMAENRPGGDGILADSNNKCWKCHGHGRKFEKSLKDYTGDKCGVCHGSGQRQASTKSESLGQQPGKVIPLRGYPEGHITNAAATTTTTTGGFLGPPAVGGRDPQLQVGELLASLGCGDWRMYQLANGHKLTVDDFICAWVAAEEMRNRGYGVATGNFGQTVVNGDDKHRSKTFRHADIGCGCGSVLMTLAWAFPNTIQSHGVEAQQVSFQLCQRGLLWNLGVDGSSASEHRVRVSHQDLRSWDGGDEDQAPYDLITGTPPYFPQDRFVASENHSQKIRCRVPTRGAAAEYVQAAARLLASDGIFVMVETARKEGEQAVLETATSCKLQVIRRLDIVTKTGLPPRFSCWVMRRRQAQDDENSQQLFNIETFTLRNVDQMRALEYVEAMEKMGWIDFENTRQKLGKKAAT